MFSAYDKAGDVSYSIGAFPTVELIKRRPEDVIGIALRSDLRMTDELAELLAPVREVTEVNDRAVSRVAKKGNAFIVGAFRKRYSGFPPGAHVALVHPSDEGNLGTIMRTMLGFGMTGLAIVGEGSADAYNPKTVRASMGAIFALDICLYPDWKSYARDRGEKKLLFMLDKRSKTLGSVPADGCALVFGNEGAGLPPELADEGSPVVIRHSREIDSLNLPQAVAIGLYETTRHIFAEK